MKEENKLFKYDYKRELLSVIVLTYKQKEYFYETLLSIFEQDYAKIELIISDDGTPNYNEEAVKKFVKENQGSNLVSFQIIHHESNVGTVRNINGALALTQGEYIKIIGGDDSYPIPSTFSKQVAALKSKQEYLATVGMAQQCDYKMVPIKDERVDRSNEDLPKVLKMDYIEARKYIKKRDIFPIAIQAICYKRDFFVRNGFCDEDYILIDDSPSVLKILMEIPRIHYMDEYTVNHRSNVGISTSKEFFAPRRLLYYKDCVTYCKKEICTHPEIYGKFRSVETLRLNEFIYNMALAKKEGKNDVQKLIIGLKYFDSILYYVLSNPQKFKKRVIHRFGK